MPIQEFSTVRPRSRIGLVDEEPTSDIRAALPGYEVYRCDVAAAAEPGRLATTAAVVFRQSRQRPRQIARQLERLAPTVLGHGCLVFVQPLSLELGASTQNFRQLIVQAIAELRLPVYGLTGQELAQLGVWAGGANQKVLTPLVHILEQADYWPGILNYLQLHPPGASPVPGPRIVVRNSRGVEQKLDIERTLLVQRAFWDSAEVRLEQLPNGLSGVDAYRAYVHQQVNQVGAAWPYRYFVKIGGRQKISTEYLRYREIALEHLPYHLGPRLRLERCELGHQSGIIVSDYVGGAEPLRDCARDGRASAVIANLFNVTFRPWHNGARRADVSLQEHLRGRLHGLVIPDFRQSLIDEYGARRGFAELADLLLAGDSQPVLTGVIHGDLHATNVLVRGGDAILIDFEKVCENAPLLRDLACLEGGLFVDGFVGDGRKPQEILTSIDPLYECEQLLNGYIDPCHPIDGSAWFFDCVIQIRMYARQLERAEGQYALMLASELMRKACNDHDFDKDGRPEDGSRGNPEALPPGVGKQIRMEQTRAMAYVLAERILTRLPGRLTRAAGE